LYNQHLPNRHRPLRKLIIPILLLLTIEVRAKAILEIIVIKTTQTIDPLTPRPVKMGENHAIMTNLATPVA